jgi:hypothetical protein
MTSLDADLARGVARLQARLLDLERRLDAGEDVWADYRATLTALAELRAKVAPGGAGELVSTREMAERLGIKPKTLLKRKDKGELKPAFQAGRLIRWRTPA